MASIRSGHVTAFYLYDVAETIDLQRVRTLIGGTVTAKLSPKPTTPSYVQYQQPPVTVDGEVVGMSELHGFRVRFKMFDYGVMSRALTRPTPTAWPELAALGLEFRYYDGVLDARLARIYAQLQVQRPLSSWFERRYNRAARQVHALSIDINELTDKTETPSRSPATYMPRVSSPSPPRGWLWTTGKRTSARSSRRSTTSTALPSRRPRWDAARF